MGFMGLGFRVVRVLGGSGSTGSGLEVRAPFREAQIKEKTGPQSGPALGVCGSEEVRHHLLSPQERRRGGWVGG